MKNQCSMCGTYRSRGVKTLKCSAGQDIRWCECCRIHTTDMPKEDNVSETRKAYEWVGRDGIGTVEVARRIRRALRERTGEPWSVYRGVGTVAGWITIKKKRDEDLNDIERAKLAKALGLKPADVHHQGVKIQSSLRYYAEFVDRAEGRIPQVTGRRFDE